ncbi:MULTISPECIES: PEP-CTERM sorting domain-containing protein, partial [Cyanophyceae]|uniref:PEP-CTERM sorting domain-containing protein n=1 Tax=Cyanophyceae TaxID=3028117 RepID=UPI001689451E
SVGKISGSTSGIDIDAFGWTQGDLFSYMRLSDDPNFGNTGTNTPGSDIDAVGVISSVPATSVPEPSSAFGLLAVSAFGVCSLLKHKWQQKKLI